MKPQFTYIKDRPEIQKLEIHRSEIYPIFVDWGKVRDTKFGSDVSNEMLLNAKKFQGCSFYRSY